MERLEAEAGDAGDPQRRPPSSRAESFMSSVASFRSDLGDADKWRNSRWRHPLGIALLLVTVFLWTTSNFLASVSAPLDHGIADARRRSSPTTLTRSPFSSPLSTRPSS
jgi:hypothetical protein